MLNPHAPECRAKYLPLPPASCVRPRSAVLIARLPLIVRATSRETYLLSRILARIFSREEHAALLRRRDKG